MKGLVTKKKQRLPFEFQRTGPVSRVPGGHKPDFDGIGQKIYSNENDINENQSNGKSLASKTIAFDTLFLVDLFGSSHFDQFKEIDASSKKLNAIDMSALSMLSSIETADFSDNKLPLEPFAIMPKLLELDLSCNSIKSFDYKSSEAMSGDERAWPSLVSLNLSFNNVGKSISDLQQIHRLSTLNLSYNGLTSLPSNLMHFTCLSYLDLTGNQLNSEPAFFSLATIQSLQTLILDKNEIFHIPKFQFGFEALTSISLKNNKIELPDDISSLIDLELLETVSICGNPLVLRMKLLPIARQVFAGASIDLRCDEPQINPKRSLNVPIKTIPLDPLSLPTFTKQHIRALNRKVSTPPSDIVPQASTVSNIEDEFFMTAFGSKANDNVPDSSLTIPPTELPNPDPSEGRPIITSVWNEVPVLQAEKRKKLTTKNRPEFVMALKKLEFIVSHPDLRLKPRESPSSLEEQQLQQAEEPNIIVAKQPVVVKQNKDVTTKLAARTEYTKTEIQQMLQSMGERLSVVERDLHIADESGQNAVDIALDQKNFAELHKKYETIRAELINTLNS